MTDNFSEPDHAHLRVGGKFYSGPKRDCPFCGGTMRLEEMKTMAGQLLKLTRHFVETGQQVMPTAFKMHNGEVTIMGVTAPAEMKGAVHSLLAQMSNEEGVDGVLFLADAYTLDLHHDDQAGLDHAIEHGIRDNPAKTEALCAMLVVRGNVASTATQPYTRGNPIHWEPLKWQELD